MIINVEYGHVEMCFTNVLFILINRQCANNRHANKQLVNSENWFFKLFKSDSKSIYNFQNIPILNKCCSFEDSVH